MVLKSEEDPNEIFFVESVGELGVSINAWSFLREHVGKDKFYQRLVFRHVNFERGFDMAINLGKFLDQAQGKQYDIGSNLLRVKSEKVINDTDVEEEDKLIIAEDRTFFCSELVAKAFKILKIIEDDDTSCTTFFPAHFGVKHDEKLKLTPGTSIESEMQIIVQREDMFTDCVEEVPADNGQE